MTITVPGVSGSVTVTVQGDAETNYAIDFADDVANIAPFNLANETTAAKAPDDYNVFLGGATTYETWTVSQPDQYTYLSSGQADTLTLTASGEYVVAGSGSSIIETVNSAGAGAGANRVVFTSGNNYFQGSTVSAAGAGDTIVGGTGSDTIDTGVGQTTVFTGSGSASVTLNDGIAGGGDVAVMDGANTTVDALGKADTVLAFGGGSVAGGKSLLTFAAINSPTGASPLPVTITGGAGGSLLFLANGSDVTYQGKTSSGVAFFVAGAGNETLNGGYAINGYAFFGDTAPSAAGTYLINGGSGGNYFATGTGSETFNVAAGSWDIFDVTSVPGASITIGGLSGAVGFNVNIGGLSVSQETSLVNAGTESGGNLTVTLSDNTTINFLGVTASQVVSTLI